MRIFRLGLTVLSLLLLSAGYLASQLAANSGGTGAEPPVLAYARTVDQPSVRYGALALLTVAIGLSLVPERVEQEQ